MVSRAIFCCLVSLVPLATRARAELPPGAYDQLKREAQELLQIRIDKVTEKERISAEMRNFECVATVVKVDRSQARLAPGAKIQFEAYYVSPDAFARGFAGPKSPPLLKAGWRGKIYLNREEGKSDFTLAAYGRSFIPANGSTEVAPPPPAPEPPSDRLGVRVRPASAGGLSVTSVDRGTLAEDLGIRSGDRLIEINGQAVNAIADIRPALQDAKGQLQIKFERRGRTLDLTLKRAG